MYYVFFTSWHTVCTEVFQNSYMNSSIITLVFFQLLRRFWWLNIRKFPKKSIEIGFKLIYWFLRVLLNTAYKTKKIQTPVFFKILTCFWCLNTSKFQQKSIGESLSSFDDFHMFFLNTAYKICRWNWREVRKRTRKWNDQKVTYDQLCWKWTIYILKVLSENQKYLPIWFYRQLNFPSIQMLYVVLH